MIREKWVSLRTAIRTIGLVICTYFIADMLKHLADKGVINVDVFYKTLVNISGSFYISWTLTGVSVIWALRERRLRRKNTKYFAKDYDNRQKKYWPEKTSSGINEDGTTRHEDKI